MTVVLVISVLVAIAIPLFVSSSAGAKERSCYLNQQTLERVVEIYLSTDSSRRKEDLAGVVDGSHPVRIENIVGSTPRCPSAPEPVDRSNPSVAEGAYTYDDSGNVLPCTHGLLGPHGHF